MNTNTRITVHCYAGDQHQIHVPAYTHHGCPVTVFSPTDSPAEVSGVENVHAGLRAYTGQLSLDRQLEHLKIMLTYPEDFFLCHDADSVCLDPIIPRYLYAEPDIVWANQVEDCIPEHQPFFHGWPNIALQPPYFLSRKTIEAMIDVSTDPRAVASPMMPFIDFYMVQLTMLAGLPWQRFRDCISCPITADPLKRDGLDAKLRAIYDQNTDAVMQSVLHKGAVMLHSVKDPDRVQEFLQARLHFLAGNPDPVPRISRAPRVGRGRVMGGPPQRA